MPGTWPRVQESTVGKSLREIMKFLPSDLEASKHLQFVRKDYQIAHSQPPRPKVFHFFSPHPRLFAIRCSREHFTMRRADSGVLSFVAYLAKGLSCGTAMRKARAMLRLARTPSTCDTLSFLGATMIKRSDEVRRCVFGVTQPPCAGEMLSVYLVYLTAAK